jgi:hypothetical protein
MFFVPFFAFSILKIFHSLLGVLTQQIDYLVPFTSQKQRETNGRMGTIPTPILNLHTAIPQKITALPIPMTLWAT